MTTSQSQSLDNFLPCPTFGAKAMEATAPALALVPLVSQGPPLAHFEHSQSANSFPSANLLPSQNVAQPYSPFAIQPPCSTPNFSFKTRTQQILESLLDACPWLSRNEIKRPETNNFSQLLFDDGLLHKSVKDYFRPFDKLDYIFDLTFHYGTSTALEQSIREFGSLPADSRMNLRELPWFQFSASQARTFGTCVVRGRLDKNARVVEIKDNKKSWDLLLTYLADTIETFDSAGKLSVKEKVDLQNQLVIHVLEQQGVDAIVMNHPCAAWKSLLVLNPDVMLLEFN